MKNLIIADLRSKEDLNNSLGRVENLPVGFEGWMTVIKDAATPIDILVTLDYEAVETGVVIASIMNFETPDNTVYRAHVPLSATTTEFLTTVRDVVLAEVTV